MCIEFQADSRITMLDHLCSLINLQAGGNFSDAVESVDDGIRLRFKYGRTPCYVREVISPEDAAWPGEDSVESVFEMGIEGREVVVGNDAWIEGVAADGDPEDLMGADRLDVLSDLGDLIGDFGEAFGFSHVVDGVYSSNPRRKLVLPFVRSCSSNRVPKMSTWSSQSTSRMRSPASCSGRMGRMYWGANVTS